MGSMHFFLSTFHIYPNLGTFLSCLNSNFNKLDDGTMLIILIKRGLLAKFGTVFIYSVHKQQLPNQRRFMVHEPKMAASLISSARLASSCRPSRACGWDAWWQEAKLEVAVHPIQSFKEIQQTAAGTMRAYLDLCLIFLLLRFSLRAGGGKQI